MGDEGGLSARGNAHGGERWCTCTPAGQSSEEGERTGDGRKRGDYSGHEHGTGILRRAIVLSHGIAGERTTRRRGRCRWPPCAFRCAFLCCACCGGRPAFYREPPVTPYSPRRVRGDTEQQSSTTCVHVSILGRRLRGADHTAHSSVAGTSEISIRTGCGSHYADHSAGMWVWIFKKN